MIMWNEMKTVINRKRRVTVEKVKQVKQVKR